MFPFKIFGKTIIGSGAEDFNTNASGRVCVCSNQLKVGVPVSFWEPSYLVDVHTSPGCLPTLGGLKLPLPWNAEQEGVITSSSQQRRSAFRHSAYYVSPLMYLLEVVLDDACSDRSAFDVGWTSEFDPTWDDDQMAMIKMPVAFAFSSLPAIMAAGLDSTAAAKGFPLNEIFWHAGSYGPLYPLTGRVADFKTMDQTGHLLTTRMLATAHTMRTLDQQLFAKGAGRSYGCEPGEPGCSSSVTKAAMCAGSPLDMPVQLVMPKKQYKLQRIFPSPATSKTATGSCCKPIGRSTILTEANTHVPLSGYKDFGYAVFRKRDCCAGVVSPSTLQ
jgi:conjugal transfer pilus assembly protein TraU